MNELLEGTNIEKAIHLVRVCKVTAYKACKLYGVKSDTLSAYLRPYLNYGFRNIRKRKLRNMKLRNFRNFIFRNLGVSMLNYGIEHGISIIP